jgi:hypothetical protein
LLAVAGIAGAVLGVPPAHADIDPIPRRTAATDLAHAIAANPRQVRRAFFSVVSPRGNPAAVSDTRLAEFPRHGDEFAILTSGNALLADDRNRRRDSGSANLGPLIRGARDVVIMRIDLRVPRNANCLTFRFRFLTEEFPEFVDDIYNDAFIAEVEDSDWDASGPEDPTITAPRNFAVDSAGRPIRVNSVGDTSLTRRQARGTTYDGATRVLRASTPIRSGGRTLYLSIFDQGDRQYDSAVFVDRLELTRNSTCTSGVVVD